MTKFWTIKNKEKDKRCEIYLYEVIGDDIFGDSTSAKDFIDALSDIPSDYALDIHFNSPGGSVTDGIAIATAIKARTGTTTAHIDALAASIASLIAVSCDKVLIAPQAAIMIHRASTYVAGNTEDMSKASNLLAAYDAQIASSYATKAGNEPNDWHEAMVAETWYFGQSAIDAGLADEIIEDALSAAACLSPEQVAKMRFVNVPEAVIRAESDTTPIIDDVEDESDDAEPAAEAADEVEAEQAEDEQTEETVRLESGIYTVRKE